MPENIHTINLRSEEVQEILTQIPNRIIRWGNVIILTLFILVFSVSYFIKYPDIITTEITITTATPPEKLVAKTSGKIEVVLVENQANVRSNTPLAVIENSATYTDVFKLKSIIDTLQIEYYTQIIDSFQNANLGDVQQAYSIFEKEFLAYQQYQKLQPYTIEKNAQNFEANQQQQRLQILIQQISITKTENQLKKKELERYRTLFTKGIISAQEWEGKNLDYLQNEKNLKTMQSQLSQLRSGINEVKKGTENTKIQELKDDVNLFKNVQQAFLQLKKSINDWDMQYVFRSKSAGKVTFLQIWTAHQTINLGETAFAIVPTNQQNIVGKLKATAQNSGKIKVNQLVNIRLNNYPDSEFGIIKGVVKSIALTPDTEGNLSIDVLLPNGLQTSYHKNITFQQEMTGTADIITEDLRIIERFLYQFRSVFKAN